MDSPERPDDFLRRVLGPSELDGIRETNHRISFAVVDYQQRLIERGVPKEYAFQLVAQMQFQLIQAALRTGGEKG